MKSLALNEFNLPIGIYRADLLPFPPQGSPNTPEHAASQSRDRSVSGSSADGGDTDMDDIPPSSSASPLQSVGTGDCSDSREEPGYDGGPSAHKHAQTPEASSEHSLPSSEAADHLSRSFDEPLGPRAGSMDEARKRKSQDVASLSDISRSAQLYNAEFHDALEVAFVELDYSENLPALPNGMPAWDRLSWEPNDAFKAFEVFLSSSRGGKVRQLKDVFIQLIARLDAGSIEMDTAAKDISMPLLRTWQILYCWAFRAKAFDMFHEACRRRHRIHLAQEVEDNQFKAAGKLFEKAMLYVDDEEFNDLMTPKVAAELLKLAGTMQRISVGLPANGPSPSSAPSSHQESLEVILRNLGKSGITDDIDNAASGSHTKTRLATDQLLGGDSDTAILAQELIIRMSSQKSG